MTTQGVHADDMFVFGSCMRPPEIGGTVATEAGMSVA